MVVYRVLVAKTSVSLVEQVQTALSDGWELQGGVAMHAAAGEGIWVWAQAMVRCECSICTRMRRDVRDASNSS
jgi:hypothetical protein